MRKVLVLLSGGLDSTVLATMAARAGVLDACVFIDYDQPALDQERGAVRLWTRKNLVELVELRAELRGREALALGAGKKGARLVPCRNLTFLALAAGIAASRGAGEVWYGATAADRADYPDCRPEFAASLSSVLAFENGPSVHAPLSGMRRADVVTLAQALDVPRAETWSCYEPLPDGRACGTCNSCCQDNPGPECPPF